MCMCITRIESFSVMQTAANNLLAVLFLLQSFLFFLHKLVHFFWVSPLHALFTCFLSFFWHTSLKLSSASQFFGVGASASRAATATVDGVGATIASTPVARMSTEILKSMVSFILGTVYLRTGGIGGWYFRLYSIELDRE